MSAFASDIDDLYAAVGRRHILPFIGSAYEHSHPSDFRIVVVGFNSYISPADWPEPEERIHSWFRGWWRNAGSGSGSHRYYDDAFQEAALLTRVVLGTPMWRHFTCDLHPKSKRSLYATNTLKVYTEEEFKKSNSIPQAEIERFANTWRAELDLMAHHGCLPHLIIVFGERIWETHWQSLHPKYTRAASYSIKDYRSAGSGNAAIRDHLNRVVLDHARGEHTLLLIRLHHPSARTPRRDARWLASHPGFQDLVS